MSKKVLPSQASFEDLMKALEEGKVIELEKEPTEEITEYDNNIVPFLSHYKIIAGDQPVNRKLLYNLYKAHVEEPLDEHHFNYILGAFLPNKNTHDAKSVYQRYYYINLDQFAIADTLFKEKRKRTIDKTKSLTYRKHFEAFLTTKNIKKGTKWLEGTMLFMIYHEHCKEIKYKKPFGPYVFHKFLKLYFKFKRVGSSRALWFNVNEETFNYYNEEQKNDIREKRRSEEAAKSNKHKSKRQASKSENRQSNGDAS